MINADDMDLEEKINEHLRQLEEEERRRQIEEERKEKQEQIKAAIDKGVKSFVKQTVKTSKGINKIIRDNKERMKQNKEQKARKEEIIKKEKEERLKKLQEDKRKREENPYPKINIEIPKRRIIRVVEDDDYSIKYEDNEDGNTSGNNITDIIDRLD